MRSKALQGPDPADDAVALGIELQIQLMWYVMKVGPSVNIEELLETSACQAGSCETGGAFD